MVGAVAGVAVTPAQRLAAFPLPLDVRNLSDGSHDHYVLLAPFVFVDGEHTYMAPAGFRTDFASVPRVCQGILDAANLLAFPSIPHDWLYATRGYVGPGLPRITRSRADHILYRACLANGVPEAEAVVVLEAVRIGGQAAWDEGESPEHLLTAQIWQETYRLAHETGPERLA